MRELVDKQFNIEFRYDIATETPREALELALASVEARSGSCWVVITTPGETEEDSIYWEGWLSEFKALSKQEQRAAELRGECHWHPGQTCSEAEKGVL